MCNGASAANASVFLLTSLSKLTKAHLCGWEIEARRWQLAFSDFTPPLFDRVGGIEFGHATTPTGGPQEHINRLGIEQSLGKVRFD